MLLQFYNQSAYHHVKSRLCYEVIKIQGDKKVADNCKLLFKKSEIKIQSYVDFVFR
jgi:hypothetical protein